MDFFLLLLKRDLTVEVILNVFAPSENKSSTSSLSYIEEKKRRHSSKNWIRKSRCTYSKESQILRALYEMYLGENL